MRDDIPANDERIEHSPARAEPDEECESLEELLIRIAERRRGHKRMQGTE